MQGQASGFTDQGSYTPENLFAGEFTRVSRVETITGNEVYPIGTVLGKITADGKFTKSLGASNDGSQLPDAILGQTLDLTTTGEAKATIYFAGEFNQNALTLGTGHTIDSVRDAFRTKSIFLRANQSA